MAYLLSAGLMFFLLIILGLKLLRKEKVTSILTMGQENVLDISICSQKYFFEIQEVSSKFWEDQKDLSSKVKSIDFEEASGNTTGLQSYKIEDIIRTVFLPTMEGSINFCHTIQVEKLPVLKRIIIVGKPGLMICLHGKGQLLNNDMTACKSNVNSYNTRLSTNELLVFFEKVHIQLKMLKVYGVSPNKAKSYDECIFNHILESSKTNQSFLQSLENMKTMNLLDFQRKLWNKTISRICADLEDSFLQPTLAQENYLDKQKFVLTKPNKMLNIETQLIMPDIVTVFEVKCSKNNYYKK